MSFKFGVISLVCAAVIAISTALAHLSCLYFGPECYAIQMAPPVIVESAKAGTLLAPLGNLLVSSIFVLWGCYALSGANIIRKLPLLNAGIYTIACLCIIRGLLPMQLWFRHPDKISLVELNVGLVWLLTGLLYLFGIRAVRKNEKQASL